MYLSAWPGLSPRRLLDARRGATSPFPLSAANTVSFYRARNAIYHLFRALHLGPGDTVLVPDYHSGNEVRAIRAAGASVRLYPIGCDMAPDLDALLHLCRRLRPRALLAIHYLGWPQPIDALASLCREREMLLIEDCALSLLSETEQGRPLGSFGDYAIFCLYKTLPVPNGGLLVQNARALEQLRGLALQPCGIASLGGRTAELLLEWIRGRSERLGRALFFLKGAAGRALSALGVDRVPVGDIGFEHVQVDVAMSALSERLLRRFDYETIRAVRRENFRLLRDRLDGSVRPVYESTGPGVCPLSFPIAVEDKGSVARALWRRGIAAVELWNEGDPATERDESAQARFLRRHVLELPIHQDISPDQVAYMADQVRRLKPRAPRPAGLPTARQRAAR